MPNKNFVLLEGYCEGEPRLMGDRGNIVSMRMRIHESRRKGDGTIFVKTEFVPVKAFGAAADFVGMYVSEGSAISVRGKVRTERWGQGDDRKSQTLIVADEVALTSLSEGQELSLLAGNLAGEGDRGEEHGSEAGSLPEPGHPATVAAAEPAGAEPRAQITAADASSPAFEQQAGIQAVPWD